MWSIVSCLVPEIMQLYKWAFRYFHYFMKMTMNSNPSWSPMFWWLTWLLHCARNIGTRPRACFWIGFMISSDCDHFKTTLILQLTKLLPCGITPACDPDRIGRRVTLSVPGEGSLKLARAHPPAGSSAGGKIWKYEVQKCIFRLYIDVILILNYLIHYLWAYN